MGVSSVESWDTMITTVLSTGCKLPREAMFRKPSNQARPGNSSTPGNKAQQNYVRSKVNNMTVEQPKDASGVVPVRFLSTLYRHSTI
jgi:hypothetical protein